MSESDFETELRALRPAAPSPQLSGRVARELRSPHRTTVRTADTLPNPRRSFARRLIPPIAWASAGAVASLGVMFWLTGGDALPRLLRGNVEGVGTAGVDASRHALSRQLAAVETSRQLVSAEEEELVFEPADEPARRVRFTYLETHAWSDPQSGVRVEFEVPREDIVLIPVGMQ